LEVVRADMQLVYWDSDCFLGWLQEEEGKQASCNQVLLECEAGNIRIITSSLTLAEVLMIRGKPSLTQTDAEKVRNFFKQPYISVRSVTRVLAENAREIVWSHGIKPKDAIHVATALAANLTTLHTFDVPLIKKSGEVGAPPLRIERPSVVAPRMI
jgi:predicted nucleic acid-binding protein